MQSNNRCHKIYLYKEDSARANALIKHIHKYNPEVLIEQVLDFEFSNYIGNGYGNGYENENENRNGYVFESNSISFFFILNEKGIESFHKYNSFITNADNGLKLVFPSLEQSYLETSKLYCRNFLSHVGLKYLNPHYVVITNQTDLDKISFKNRVIKADELSAGKGVFVYADHFKTDEEAKEIITRLLETNSRILLEEKLEGEEFSCITLSWNGVITHFPLVKDFKRLEDGDNGLNTGGMGTISFAGGSMPFLNEDELRQCKTINETIIIETNFRGFLYGSFMKTHNGQLKVIEYNVRLGDSEAVNILELLDSSLLLHLADPVKYPLVINTLDNTYFRYLVPRDYARISNSKLQKKFYYLVDHNMPEKAFYLANSKYIDIDNSSGVENNELSSVGGLYSVGTSRTCGILTKNIDASMVVAENDRLIHMVYGNLHYRCDIGKKMLDLLANMNNYNFTSSKNQISHLDNQISNLDNQISHLDNYIGHLDNYNYIITDIKKKIDFHNLEVESSNPAVKVLGRIGDFANSIQIGNCKMICSVDGAGTKTKFLEGHPRRFEILGKDIVIHNINDMYCNNGIPVALLDYYGCDKLNKGEFSQFINGVLDICREYGIALIGGETAEMRGIFQAGEIEVLGILLGILEDRGGPANGVGIQAGNFIYGLESHGAHTNGFTKIRDIASKTIGGMPNNIREFFSQPHRCYVRIVDYLTDILRKLTIKILGKAHITGGGFQDNIERILPEGLGLDLDLGLEPWQLATEWQWLYENADMNWNEFIRVFNAGWGFCIVVDKEIPEGVLADFEKTGINGKIKLLGRIIKSFN